MCKYVYINVGAYSWHQNIQKVHKYVHGYSKPSIGSCRRGSIEWHARLPDLNAMDFYLWGRKYRLCAQGHDTRECPNRHLPLKCARCGGGHEASSTECPKVIKHKQQNRPRPKANLTEQLDFPPLPVTNITQTPPQIPRNYRHPTSSNNANTNDTSLATLITLLSSPQTQQILELLTNLLQKITSNPNTLTQISNFLTTMTSLIP